MKSGGVVFDVRIEFDIQCLVKYIGGKYVLVV